MVEETSSGSTKMMRREKYLVTGVRLRANSFLPG